VIAVSVVSWKRLRAVALAVVAVASLVPPAGTALAHAELISSSPANGAILAEEPTEIVLRFSENVDMVGESIRMVDAQGTPRPLGVIDQSLGKNTIRADIPAQVTDGTYVVGWQAISADSHKIRGAFTFSVGVETRPAPGVIDELFAQGAASTSDSLLLGAGRFLSFAGIGVLVGALFMASVLVPELIGRRRIGALLVGAALAGVVGTALMILAQAHLVTGSYFRIADVVRIESGQWWLARLAVIGLLALFIPARGFITSTAGRVVVALAGLVAFGVVAAGGHAVAGDQALLGFASTVVHLAAMSVWIGGLALLVMGVPRNWFWWTASQFSPWALGSVVALAATGAVNSWRQLGALSDLTETSFGRWLVVKLVLVAVVVAAAAVSRRLSRSDDEDDEDHADVPAEEPVAVGTPAVDAVAAGPAATSGAGDGSITDPPVRVVDDGDHEPVVQEAPAALRRSVVFELVGMALILMATAGLVNSPPPPSAPTVESASAVVGDRIVQVELEPAVTGGTEMHVYLSSPGGGFDSADELTVEASLPAADLGPLAIDTLPAGPNHVVADVDLPVAGLWRFTVTARFGEFDQVVFTVDLPVTD
jgi:copper transport protein